MSAPLKPTRPTHSRSPSTPRPDAGDAPTIRRRIVEVVVTERRANKPGPSRFVLRVDGRAPAPLRRCTDCRRPLAELEAITCARCEAQERAELAALVPS